MSSPLLPNKDFFKIKKNYGSFTKGTSIKLIQPLGSNDEYILKTCDLSNLDKDAREQARNELREEYNQFKFPYETLFKSFGSFYDVLNKQYNYTMTSVKFSLKYYIEEYLDPKLGGLDYQKVLPICFDLIEAFSSIRLNGFRQRKDFTPQDVFFDHRGRFILSREHCSELLKEIFPVFFGITSTPSKQNPTPKLNKITSSDESLEELESRYVLNIGVIVLYCLNPFAFEKENMEQINKIPDKFLLSVLEKLKPNMPMEFFIVLRNMLFSESKYRLNFNDMYVYFSNKRQEVMSQLEPLKPFPLPKFKPKNSTLEKLKYDFSAKSKDLSDKFEALELSKQQNLRAVNLSLAEKLEEKDSIIIKSLLERPLFIYQLKLEFEKLEKTVFSDIIKSIHHSSINELNLKLGSIEIDCDIANELERVLGIQTCINKLSLCLENTRLSDFDGRRIIESIKDGGNMENLKLDFGRTLIGDETVLAIQKIIGSSVDHLISSQISLNFSKTKVTPVSIGNLISEIKKHSKIITLFEFGVGGLNFGSDVYFSIFDLSVNMKGLKSLSLNLSNSKLNSKDLSLSLLGRMVILQELTNFNLDISETQITGDFSKSLLQTVKTLTKLSVLTINIGDTKLEKDKGIEYILLNINTLQQGLTDIFIYYRYPTEKSKRKDFDSTVEDSRKANKNEYSISIIEINHAMREFCFIARRK